MSLCDSCNGINVPALASESGYQHLGNVRDLRSSAENCRLCAVIRSALNQNTAHTSEPDNPFEADYYENHLEAEPITLHGVSEGLYDRSLSGEGYALTRPYRLWGIEIHVSSKYGDDIGYISLFAEPGASVMSDTPIGLSAYRAAGSLASTSGAVSGRPICKDVRSEGFDLIKRWMRNCVHNHKKCRCTIAAGDIDETAQPELPRRVLDVGNERVRLIDTSLDGEPQAGHYAALSHCWGPKQLLTTTESTFRSRIDGINFEDLPRTFQDAVTVTRTLCLRYIWIDSLCIIQDSRQDWLTESAKMGTVYQNASIVIAASGAGEGSEGCFIPRTSIVEPIKLLFHSDDGAVSGCMFVSLLPDEGNDNAILDRNPLAKRAWITQEWILARRIIHFTRAQLVWSCKTEIETESGQPIYDDSATQSLQESPIFSASANDSDVNTFIDDWCEIVVNFCGRQLTYESDKLVALQGVVNEVLRRIGNTYRYHFGVWSARLPQQILWFARDILARPQTLKSTPSWSWASTMGVIVHHNPGQTAQDLAQCLRIEDKKLLLQTLLAPIPQLRGPIMPHSPEAPYAFHCQSKSTFATGAAVMSWRMYLMSSIEEDRLGWVSFDQGVVPPDPIYMLPISKNVFNGADDGFNILLVAPAKIDDTAYERVGMGEVLYTDLFTGRLMQQICLV
ncbi:hypothetical protein W97_01673 [Coniosporium apollinis CBS 100218]|uniref:Heterokaryon incompatibility domain-containing protein n=1 Tax=Coniosporium apollinis (strain CBS 100218) TaxID=1168221 RepID=R7YLD3_CONA1|nr:uncharacterized protein W97_01673 [Coniosporium apollinis CBS 100218]EON62451.1 hypothetical protein W97_01673 [Coniosporium apollinis CBS 100218]